MVLAVALSGGVDSAVAALLLKRRHTRMVGASHVIWPGSRCCSEEVLGRARETCARLQIPYIQEDLQAEFREHVVEDFIRTYLNGKTPNPCVLCNKIVRFDLFYHRLQQTLRSRGMLQAGEPLHLATGHYARIVNTGGGSFIARAADPLKDQSYMLYQVDPAMLSNMVFPLGEHRKAEVVALAGEHGLAYTRVRESQDACFVENDYAGFIREQTGRSDILRTGQIVNREGRVLGRHRGTIHYTVGQRRGLGLGNGPWYVTRIDAEANRLVVARAAEAGTLCFSIHSTNWFIPRPQDGLSCSVKIRYQVDSIPCIVEAADTADVFRVCLERAHVVTPGQSAVFYDGELLLGGGIIT